VSGELVYAGADAKAKGGVLSYWHDLLYISAFVQLVGAASDRAWLAFLLVRAGGRGGGGGGGGGVCVFVVGGRVGRRGIRGSS
jgi:hypothetical protein